jgi:hypothetical protein
VVQVVRANRVRVEVDAAEVDDPRQLRCVVQDDLLGRPPRREAQLDGPDPLRALLRRPLLEEELPLRAVDEPLHGHRAIACAAKGAVGDREVVTDKIDLRVAGAREEDLVGVADRDLPARDLEDLLRSRHRDTLAPHGVRAPAWSAIQPDPTGGGGGGGGVPCGLGEAGRDWLQSERSDRGCHAGGGGGRAAVPGVPAVGACEMSGGRGGSGADCCQPADGAARYPAAVLVPFPNTCQPMMAALMPMMMVRNGTNTTWATAIRRMLNTARPPKMPSATLKECSFSSRSDARQRASLSLGPCDHPFG